MEFEDGVKEISNKEMLSSTPVVSVLMITYNHEKYIAQAIDGVVAQKTDFPIELIIAEDCSTDKTREIVLDYQVKYPALIRVLVSDGNVGVNANFVRAHARCKGEFIAYCEGDDYWCDPNKLQLQVGCLSNNPDYVAVYHDAIVVNADGKLVSGSRLNGCAANYSAMDLIMIRALPTQTLMHRNVIDEYPDEFYKVVNADSFIISLLGQYGGAIFLENIANSAYRIHDGGIWSGIRADEKNIKTMNTYYWMSVYYARIGRNEISSRFSCLAMNVVHNNLKPMRSLFLKWALSTEFSNAYMLYLGIKKSLNRLF